MILRTCTNCNESKPETSEFFGKDRDSFASCCKICRAEKQRRRWRENPEAKVLDKRFRERNKEKIKAYDKIRSKRDRAKKREWQKQWRSNNHERQKVKSVEYASKRRALIRSAAGSFTADDVESMKAAQKNVCWWCGTKILGVIEIDHRIPLSKGGSNDKGNIVISCRPCNRSKSNKMPWEFLGRLL